MQLSKKHLGMLVFFIFVQLNVHLNAWGKSSRDYESLVALIRIPIGIAANSVNLKTEKTKSDYALILANDVLRILNGVLSISHKPKPIDFNSYDFCWVAYDVASLINHLKSYLKNDKKGWPVFGDVRELGKDAQGCHSIIFPFFEGITALKYSSYEENSSNACFLHWFNTLVRLCDNIMISKDKERLIYVLLCIASFVEFYRQKQVAPHDNAHDQDNNHQGAYDDDFFRNFFGGGGTGGCFGASNQAAFSKACQTLGVNEGDNFEDISRAYKKLAMQYHPDKNRGNPGAARRMQEINDAMDDVRKHFNRK